MRLQCRGRGRGLHRNCISCRKKVDLPPGLIDGGHKHRNLHDMTTEDEMQFEYCSIISVVSNVCWLWIHHSIKEADEALE
jgi:hypothetical protein